MLPVTLERMLYLMLLKLLLRTVGFFTTFSKILLLGNPKGHSVNTSIGVFAQGADVHAVVPAMTDLLPRPVTCDEGLDHSEYKAVLTALMNLNLDTLLMNHRKQTAELVAGLETSINDLRVQLEEETKVRAQELDAIRQHVKEVETLFGLQ